MTGKHIVPKNATTLAKAEAALVPATPEQVAQAVTVLLGQFKAAENVTNPDLFVRGMVEELSRYPQDILNEAIRVARRKFDWVPSIAQMVDICRTLMKPRREEARYQRIKANGIEHADDYHFMIGHMAKQMNMPVEEKQRAVMDAAQKPALTHRKAKVAG